jgi:hypothetical protein
LILFEKFFDGRIVAGLLARIHRPYSTLGYSICPACFYKTLGSIGRTW